LHGAPLDAWLILPMLRALGRKRCERILLEGSLRTVAQAFELQRVLPGLADWTLVPTPGHTPRHTAFFRSRDRVLICGDALATVELNHPWSLLAPRPGLSGPPWYSTWDWAMAQASLRRLADLEPCVLACGHGPPMIGVGSAAALRSFVAEVVSASAPAIPATVPPPKIA
jgi:glyoxylase-like metal-dependent hydrolase (beta-lactamase superfamily II)